MPTLALTAALLLLAGCMTGPILVSSGHAGDTGATLPAPREELPGAPAVRAAPP